MHAGRGRVDRIARKLARKIVLRERRIGVVGILLRRRRANDRRDQRGDQNQPTNA
jgi:hypothetical protein